MKHWAGRSVADTCARVAVWICLSFAISLPARGQPAPPVSEELEFPEEGVEGINGLIQYIIIKNLPAEYEDASKWGRTKEIWAGLKISRDGLQIKTKRRKKEVNHGSWEKYRAWPIDPESAFEVRVEHSRNVPGKGLGFDLVVTARLGVSGRWSEWQRGLQLYSLSAEAEAKVRLRLSCVVGMAFDLSSLPIAVSFEPTVTDAQLDLVEFRLHRVSKLDGPVVRELGRALRDVLQREIGRRSGKLVKRINDQIEKNRDELRFSLDGILPGKDELWKDFG